MQTSDIIAILAIVVSALVSIIAVITSYNTNRLNIQARRGELAFERQAEAFREIADKLGGIRRTIIGLPIPYDEKSMSYFFSAVQKAVLDYHFTYQKYRVYVPSDLDAVLRDFTKKAIAYYSDEDYAQHKDFIEEFNVLEPKIIALMNKHLGIK